MGIRPKLFLVFFTCGIVPMLIFAVANYWSGVSAVEELLGRDVEREARAATSGIEADLREREAKLVALSRSLAVREYVRGATRPTTTSDVQAQPSALPAPSSSPAADSSGSGAASERIPADVRAEVEALLLDAGNGYVSLTCLKTDGQPLFRAEATQSDTGSPAIRYQIEDILLSSVAPDQRVWTMTEQSALRSALESYSANVRYTLPLFTAERTAQAPRGALVVELNLNVLCKAAISSFAGTPAAPRVFVILDDNGRVIYHTNENLNYQLINAAMPPSFKPIADAMLAGRSGQQSYDGRDGDRWLASYQPVKSAGVFLSVSGDETAALSRLRRNGWLSILLSALAGLTTAILLTLIARRMERSIERLTAGAVAIAGGQLNERIEVRSSDETRLLAESFNRMTDRLREQIARESETRQFESFMRLAAMLTHDLKNSITALSLVVSNMEQQFDNKEFRAEAMESLKESTDKLRSLVAKLSGPVESLSGEYQRPRPTDLVPHLKRVLGTTAEQARSHHTVEIHLPDALVATVDAERIERVFENLVLNALEAMGANSGTLTIEAGPENDSEIFFSVADTGPGISEEFQRTHLFRAFATTKRKGVGLGLYTCREVAKAHGGRIEVKSAKGAGATFRVVLPSALFTGGK
ncbi:MAG: hypothetical protein QOF02_1763 [Blastocatellia bacterium]|nr:hypothetical protein [Blastocatellia bacterium]